MTDKTEQADMSPDDKLINEAMARFEMAQEASSDFRRQANEDLQFCADDQWEALARQAREVSGRPCMQIDRINPAIRQVVNESRQNRPSIEIDPTGSGADEDTAYIYGGLIRHIEYDSGADVAYDTAVEYATKTGLGYFRLVTDYEAPDSFDQKLLIKPIHDPATVFVDPFHQEMNGSDMEFAFIIADVSHEDFLRQYPESRTKREVHEKGGWDSVDVPMPGWITAETVRVAEYMYKNYTKKKLYQLQNNRVYENGMPKITTEFSSPEIEEGLKDGTLSKLNEREVQDVAVKIATLTAGEILNETDWPSQYIPLFPVKGEEFWVNGERFCTGIVRRARDPQRALNYLRSAQIEAVDLAPKAPFIGVAGQFDTFEADWRDANRKNLAYLEYNAVDVNGNPAAAPQRSSVEPAIQAIMATGNSAIDDIKAVTGVFDASLGNQSNEESGVAIIARKEQTSNSNFHYYDNLVGAIKHLGRCLLDCIPTYYDTERTVRIVKPNGDQELKQINTLLGNGKKVDFSVGRYDCIVKTGPTYQTKRQRMVEDGTALIKAYPQAAPLIADLLVSASDFEGSQEIAARLRTQVPPNVLAATDGDDDGSSDPKQQIAALTMQVEQAQQSLQALNAHAQQVEQELKMTKQELELEKLDNKADVTKAELDYNIKAKQLALDEATTELEFLIKQQDFELKKKQLELQEAQVHIKAVHEMGSLNADTHDREMDWLDRSRDKTIHTISEVKPLPELDVGAPDLNHVELGAQMNTPGFAT